MHNKANHPSFNSKIEKGKLFDFITPYGYGGFLFKSKYSKKNIEIAIQNYCDYCRRIGVVSEFVRFHPLIENFKMVENLVDTVYIGKTIYINTNSIEEIWNNFSKENRNMVRKSVNNGVKIYWGRSEQLLCKFKELYFQTMDRDDANQYYYFSDLFYDSLLHDMKYNLLFFYSEYEKNIISIAAILIGNTYIHYHLSASDYNYRYLAPTNQLLYEVAKYANGINRKYLHLGGGLGGKEDNLYKFKKAFNKNDNKNFHIGIIIFDEETYNYLCEISNKSIDTSFFQGYRQS